MKIYKNLQEYLDDKQISQRSLAKLIGISPAHLNDMISGRRRPSPKLAVRIERITGIPFRVLLLAEREQSVA